MIGLGLSINLANSDSPGSPPEPPQFTADWGNINTINDLSPTIFWASTSGATTNAASATLITYTGSTISVTMSVSGTGGVTQIFYIKNGGADTPYSGTFQMANGDTLKIGIRGPSAFPISGSGNLTVTNATDAYVIDTIPYTVEIE